MGSGYRTERSVKTIYTTMFPQSWRETLANEPNTPIPPLDDDEDWCPRNVLVISINCSPKCANTRII